MSSELHRSGVLASGSIFCMTVIQADASEGSEASMVFGDFHQMTEANKQEILNFLRSL